MCIIMHIYIYNVAFLFQKMDLALYNLQLPKHLEGRPSGSAGALLLEAMVSAVTWHPTLSMSQWSLRHNPDWTNPSSEKIEKWLHPWCETSHHVSQYHPWSTKWLWYIYRFYHICGKMITGCKKTPRLKGWTEEMHWWTEEMEIESRLQGLQLTGWSESRLCWFGPRKSIYLKITEAPNDPMSIRKKKQTSIAN